MLACFDGAPPKTLGFQVSLVFLSRESDSSMWGSDSQMAVEMDYADRSIGFVYAPQQRQRDSVVSAKRDDSRQRLPMLGRAQLVCVGGRLAHQDAVVAFFDLLDSIRIVIPDRELARCTYHRLGRPSPYEVTGISPQSRTVAQLLNGFASSGTLYPPLNRTLREPCDRTHHRKRYVVYTYYKLRRREPCLIPLGPKRAPGRYEVPVSNGAPVD